MKALKLAALALATTMTALNAAAEEVDVMKITLQNGNTSFHNVAEVEDIQFNAPTKNHPKEIAGHEFVDLGLPSKLKWATCNLGAVTASDYGDYYAWGELKPKEKYTGDNSAMYDKSLSTLRSEGVVNSRGVLTTYYDAATQSWGSSWRMPTKEEIQELVDNCTFTWASLDNHIGAIITGPNGNTMFMPGGGYREDYKFESTIYQCKYWSSTAVADNDYRSYTYFGQSGGQELTDNVRRFGLNIRPVTTEEYFEPLEAPQNVHATIDDDYNITVTWDPVEGATYYRVMGAAGDYPLSEYYEAGIVKTGTTFKYFNDYPGYKYYRIEARAEGAKSEMSEKSNLIVCETKVNYVAETIDGHECIDLGLPSGKKWAVCNLGADKFYDDGSYYRWGETLSYDPSGTSLWDGKTDAELLEAGVIDASGNLTAAHDAAATEWGGNWRMPTKEDLQELIDVCGGRYAFYNERFGWVFHSPNGNSLFLPMAGYWTDPYSFPHYQDKMAYYWTATSGGNGKTWACPIESTIKNTYVVEMLRANGYSVRAVIDANTIE